jgi:FKBP-type peptidyl-prolyl cis-trans isomerase FkpA
MKAATATLFLGLCAAAFAVLPVRAEEPAASAPATPPSPPASQAAPSPFDVIKTPGGVEYRELAVGTGKTAYPGSKVFVNYTGWLQNSDGSRGTQFDSNRNTGLPLTFMLGDGKVIRGWEMGMQGMKVGGKRRLIIPSALGYGAKGTTSIPPYSNLIFDVELVNVE